MANRKASQAQVFVVGGPSSTPRKSSRKSSRSTKRPSTSAPRRTNTTTRTVSEVARSGSKPNNTPYLVGAGVLALAGVLLYANRAGAAETPPGQLPPGGGVGPQGPQGVPGAPGAFPQAPGGPAGYAGPGTYRVTAPSGLNVRSAPSGGAGQVGSTLPPGTAVQVIGSSSNGWVQISTPVSGFMCISCPEAPGGVAPNPQAFPPWLQRTA